MHPSSGDSVASSQAADMARESSTGPDSVERVLACPATAGLRPAEGRRGRCVARRPRLDVVKEVVTSHSEDLSRARSRKARCTTWPAWTPCAQDEAGREGARPGRRSAGAPDLKRGAIVTKRPCELKRSRRVCSPVPYSCHRRGPDCPVLASTASRPPRAFSVPDTAANGASEVSTASAPLAARCPAPIRLAGAHRVNVSRSPR
jgi:hypothetical protein